VIRPALFLACLLFGASCTTPPPEVIPERPAYVPATAHYVRSAEGILWVTLQKKTSTDYVASFFGGSQSSPCLCRLEGGLPDLVTADQITHWDGVCLHLTTPGLKLRSLGPANG
jgi:hypothetical protein